nr:hypothetical protein REQ54_04334 [Rhizobium sp. Q54]
MTYVPYSKDLETVDDDEPETVRKIIEAMGKGGDITRERHGRSVRTSHAKAHGLLKGELHVFSDLSPELRQGLFAEAKTYPVIARLAHVPGEFLDDRKVSTPRGMALKIIGIEGEMLSGHKGEVTQDFVLDTGKVFNAPTAKFFLGAITATEASAALPEGVKSAVSSVSRGTNAVLNAVGLNSANLDFYGHPFNHPLAEEYFSQVPMRYGGYVAKLGVFPVSPGLKELAEQGFKPEDENGLRTATMEYFKNEPAEYEVRIQLCTDLEAMPIENAATEWPEEQSPYRPVARLIFPPQDAYSPERQSCVDEELSFCPSHSLAAHRLLGSIGRARLAAYPVMADARRRANGKTTDEPRGVDQLPF